MKRIFLAIAVLCYTGAVYGQDGGRIHRSEFVPFDTREDADALNRKNTDKYLVFAPGLLNDGEEVLGIGDVVNLPNGWFDSFIYLHLENTGTAYTLRVNDRTVAVKTLSLRPTSTLPPTSNRATTSFYWNCTKVIRPNCKKVSLRPR